MLSRVKHENFFIISGPDGYRHAEVLKLKSETFGKSENKLKPQPASAHVGLHSKPKHAEKVSPGHL